jgi:hypothetical protein
MIFQKKKFLEELLNDYARIVKELERLKARVDALEESFKSLRTSFAARSRWSKRDMLREYIAELAQKDPEKAKKIAELLDIQLEIV